MSDDTPPGADAMERSSRVWYTEIDGKPQSPGWTIAAYARAIEQAQREARAAAIEEVMAAIKNLPPCPFDKPTMLKPEEPCPVCGDTGEFNDNPSNCGSPMIAIRALTAKPGSKT